MAQNATYMGLAVPLFPDSASSGIHLEAQGSASTYDILTITNSSAGTGDFLVLESGDASTELFWVEDNGVTNWALTSPGADNCLAVVITDTSTVTSGYLQGSYVSITMDSGCSYTTTGAQINAFAADIILDGTIGCEVEGAYFYIAAAATAPTLTSANINGLQVYIDDLKSSPSIRSGLQLHIADGNAGSVNDAFVLMRIEGASGAVTSMFEKAGTATNPTYFLKTNAVDGMILAGDFLAGTPTASHGMAVVIGGLTRYIPLIANT